MKEMQFTRPDAKEFDYIKKLTEEYKLDARDLKAEQFIITKKDRAFAGFARLIFHPDCVEIANVAVLPHFRKQGIGAKLVHQLLNQSEADHVYLVTTIPGYFKKIGFKKTKDIPTSLKSKIMDCRELCHDDEAIYVMVI